MRELAERLNRLCDQQPFETTWHLKDLHTGETADREGTRVVPSASTRKISIMMAALRAVHNGRLSLIQSVTMQSKYQDNNSGTFQHLFPGFTITLRDVLVMMIIVSDNTCTGTVADLLGLEDINRFCSSIGMVGTTHRQGIPRLSGWDHGVDESNATTANDVGLLLDLILRGTTEEEVADRLGCSTDLCQLALDILSWQRLNSRIPYLLPAGTRVAHKTGTGARNINDAGIIFDEAGPRFILSAYTDRVPVEDVEPGVPGFAAAQLHIAHLARACWDQLS